MTNTPVDERYAGCWEKSAVLAEPISGRDLDLAGFAFHRVVAQLFLHRATGSLTLHHSQFEKLVVFRDGYPVLAESNLADESLERFLVKRELLDEPTLYAALSEAVAQKRPLAEILVAGGQIEPSVLFSALRRNFGLCILNAFRTDVGKLRFDASTPDLENRLELKMQPSALLLRGICGFSPLNGIQAEFQEAIDLPFRIRPQALEDMKELQLNTVDRRAADVLSDPHTVSSLAQTAKISDEMALRLLYSFALLGLAGPAALVEKEQRSQQEAARATVPEPAPAAPPSDTLLEKKPLVEAMAKAIDHAYLVVKGQTYFQVLGVEENASPEEVKRAFIERCHHLSPMRFADYELGERIEQVEEIFVTLARAYAFLSHPGLRKEYQKRLAAKENKQAQQAKQPKATAGAAFAIKTELLKSDTHIAKGLEMIKQKRYSEAAKYFSFAVDVDATNPKAYAHLAMAYFLTDPATGLATAIQFIQKGLAINPQSAVVNFNLGRIYEMARDKPQALAAYRQCLQADPQHKSARAAVLRLQ